jgi:hypothetical protein
MQRAFFSALLISTLAATACKSKTNDKPAEGQSDEQTPPAAEPKKAEPAPEPTEADQPAEAAKEAPGAPALTAEGLGPLRAGMELSEPALAKLFPDYQVKKAGDADEGQRFTVFEVRDGEDLLMVITPKDDGTVSSARIEHPSIAEADSPFRVGETFSDYSAVEGCGCLGEDGMRGYVCQLKEKDYSLVFKAKGGDCGLPPLPKSDDIVGRKVIALRWRPAAK